MTVNAVAASAQHLEDARKASRLGPALTPAQVERMSDGRVSLHDLDAAKGVEEAQAKAPVPAPVQEAGRRLRSAIEAQLKAQLGVTTHLEAVRDEMKDKGLQPKATRSLEEKIAAKLHLDVPFAAGAGVRRGLGAAPAEPPAKPAGRSEAVDDRARVWTDPSRDLEEDGTRVTPQPVQDPVARAIAAEDDRWRF